MGTQSSNRSYGVQFEQNEKNRQNNLSRWKDTPLVRTLTFVIPDSFCGLCFKDQSACELLETHFLIHRMIFGVNWIFMNGDQSREHLLNYCCGAGYGSWCNQYSIAKHH